MMHVMWHSTLHSLQVKYTSVDGDMHFLCNGDKHKLQFDTYFVQHQCFIIMFWSFMNSDSWVAQSTIAKHIDIINETNHYGHFYNSVCHLPISNLAYWWTSNEIYSKNSNPYMKSMMYWIWFLENFFFSSNKINEFRDHVLQTICVSLRKP